METVVHRDDPRFPQFSLVGCKRYDFVTGRDGQPLPRQYGSIHRVKAGDEQAKELAESRATMDCVLMSTFNPRGYQ